MADRASADRVSADMQPANYRAAVQLIRHSIEKKKEKLAEVQGKIGDDWTKVEGYKVNKKGGRIFAMMDKLEHEERVDIMRTINGLIDAAGWEETEQDLVDAAEGNVVHLRLHGQQDDDADEGNAAGEGDDGEAEMAEVEAALAEPVKSRRGRKAADPDRVAASKKVAETAERARENVRRQLGEEPPAEPYTGDNSDLADE
jgi:hypothetical protein